MKNGYLKQPNQFHIDSGHEFALLVYEDGAGPMIENNLKFCSAENKDCATYPKKFKPCVWSLTFNLTVSVNCNLYRVLLMYPLYFLL